MKCNHVSARSMEIFRRLGVAQAIRDAGLPADYPERRRVPHHASPARSCRASRFRAGATAIPPAAARTPGGRRPSRRTASTRSISNRSLFDLRRGDRRAHAAQPHAVNDFEQDDRRRDRARHADLDDRRDVTIRARLPRRLRRRPLGRAQGDRRQAVRRPRSCSACNRPISARRTLLARADRKPGLGHVLAQSRAAAATSMRSTAARPGWCTIICRPDEHDFDSVDRDWAMRTILGVGDDFRYEILSKEDWIGRRLVADKLSRPPRVHLRRRRAPVGAVWPATA